MDTLACEDAAMVVRTAIDELASSRSPFRVEAEPLPPAKFADPQTTANGAARAEVPLIALETLWFNTGTLCNLTCANCYIESSPINDALIYLTAAEVRDYLQEITAGAFATREIGFTGGEPFMNRDIGAMLEAALSQGHEVLVLTNAMLPMRHRGAELQALKARYGRRLTLRVSLDHYTRDVHEKERGPRSWAPALDGLRWLSDTGFSIAVAGRHLGRETDREARAGYASLFEVEKLSIDVQDPACLVLFPEMDARADVAEITTACWGILGKNPADIMCATSRMVVHRKGEPRARVAACTLIPYAPGFDMGGTLAESLRPVALNHPHCARFCVLGGASCSI